jgi:hypothetical protein
MMPNLEMTQTNEVENIVAAAQRVNRFQMTTGSSTGLTRRIAKTTGARLKSEPAPIWFAVLVATQCQASGNGDGHAVRWDYVSARAVYTNTGANAQSIQPLGIRLQSGHTLAVYWMPTETEYTIEVSSRSNHCAA